MHTGPKQIGTAPRWVMVEGGREHPSQTGNECVPGAQASRGTLPTVALPQPSLLRIPVKASSPEASGQNKMDGGLGAKD